MTFWYWTQRLWYCNTHRQYNNATVINTLIILVVEAWLLIIQLLLINYHAKHKTLTLIHPSWLLCSIFPSIIHKPSSFDSALGSSAALKLHRQLAQESMALISSSLINNQHVTLFQMALSLSSSVSLLWIVLLLSQSYYKINECTCN
jgi:hypothetical protein